VKEYGIRGGGGPAALASGGEWEAVKTGTLKFYEARDTLKRRWDTGKLTNRRVSFRSRIPRKCRCVAITTDWVSAHLGSGADVSEGGSVDITEIWEKKGDPSASSRRRINLDGRIVSSLGQLNLSYDNRGGEK